MPSRMATENHADRKRTKGSSGAEYLLEFIRQGAYVRIAALDPVTGTEVITVGDAKRSKKELTRVAVRKLEFVLRKNARKSS